MVKKVMWAVITLFIGAALIFMGARECIVYVTKSTVSLNTAPFSDFSKVAAATDEMKAALDANLDGWIEYDDGKTDEIPAAVHFEGKLWKQPKNDDYIKYRDDFAAECGLDKSYIAEYRAQDTKIKADCFAVLGIGVVCFLFGIIDSLLIVRKFRRRNEQY